MTVIFATSDSNFPEKLEKMTLQPILYFSDLSPGLTYKILTEKWMLGKHLSFALISLFGGVLWDIYYVIKQLDIWKWDFVPDSGYNLAMTGRIVDALNYGKGNEEKNRMKKTLRELAEKGFATIPRNINPFNDNISRVLSEKYIASVVHSGYVNPSLSEEVFRGKTTFHFLTLKFAFKTLSTV
jgi:hypothetical protein